MVEDPGERRNLARERPEIKDRWELQLRRWWEAKLGTRADSLREQAKLGVPAKAWVEKALQSRNLTWNDWVRTQRYI